MLLPRMVSTYECAPTLLGQPKCQNNNCYWQRANSCKKNIHCKQD